MLPAKFGNVADLGSVEEERCLKELIDLKIRGSSQGTDGSDKRRSKDVDIPRRRSGRESNRDKVDYDDKRNDRERGWEGGEQRQESRGSASLSWFSRHIRVRIISKEYKGGRLYLQKGEVVDVVGPMTCDVSMNNSRELTQSISQELLKTALPRRGGPVLVLYGTHKGVYGSLVEKDMETETVRDTDTHVMLVWNKLLSTSVIQAILILILPQQSHSLGALKLRKNLASCSHNHARLGMNQLVV